MNGRRKRMKEKEILSQLVSFNTINDKQNKQILDYIQVFLSGLGFFIQKREKYLIASIGKTPILGFIGHSDTVDIIDGWKTNPFELTQVNDQLFGLGSCDMKGGIAAFLQAISEIQLEKLKKGMKIYITYDEEIGFTGIEEVVKIEENMPDYLLIGEPTDNQILTGCKGLFAVKIHTHGIKVHSSNPAKGRSANSNMVKFLKELEDFYEQTIKQEKIELYDIPYTTMNIGLINGGNSINSVADHCMSYVDFRTVKQGHVSILKNQLNALSQKYDANYEIDLEISPFYNEIPFIQERKTANFMTEASWVKGKRMILGPGPVTAHEVDEYISAKSLRKTVEQYKAIIEKLCLEK